MKRRLTYRADRRYRTLDLDDLRKFIDDAEAIGIGTWRAPVVVLDTNPRSQRVGRIREIRIEEG